MKKSITLLLLSSSLMVTAWAGIQQMMMNAKSLPIPTVNINTDFTAGTVSTFTGYVAGGAGSIVDDTAPGCTAVTGVTDDSATSEFLLVVDCSVNFGSGYITSVSIDGSPINASFLYYDYGVIGPTSAAWHYSTQGITNTVTYNLQATN